MPWHFARHVCTSFDGVVHGSGGYPGWACTYGYSDLMRRLCSGVRKRRSVTALSMGVQLMRPFPSPAPTSPPD